ncbi:MAG: efflux RND transporter periplasmic adaptor subunit [bacterium]|nr:efflux RND transporter periplasmic adaptor subunit [bacterium]
MSARTPISRIFLGGLKVALPVFALFVGIYSYLTLKSNRPPSPKPQKHETVQPVRTMLIHLSSHQPALKLYGEIKSGRKLELRTLVAGKVFETGTRFREGALVKKGDLLFSIDPFSYKGAVVEANANMVEARARLKENTVQTRAEETSIRYAVEQLRIAKRDMERAKKLMRKGSVTRQGGDQRALIVSQRRQTLDSKRANLAILRAKAEQQTANINSLKWRLQQARRNHRDTQLKAPFSGYINEINANVGKLLNVNDRVAVLLDADWMEAVFTLSDRQYGRLLAPSSSEPTGQKIKPSGKKAVGQQENAREGLIGRQIKVTWKLGATYLTYNAVVERIGARISSESGGVKVYARLLNPSYPQPIRDGAFVDVRVPDRLYHKVARLPQTALYGRSKVYIVGSDKRLRERLVKLHAIDGEFVLVSGALADYERVVVTRMSVIGGGMKVNDLDVSSGPSNKSGNSGTSSDAKPRNKNSWKPIKGDGSARHPGARRQGNQGNQVKKPRDRSSLSRAEQKNRG